MIERSLSGLAARISVRVGLFALRRSSRSRIALLILECGVWSLS